MVVQGIGPVKWHCKHDQIAVIHVKWIQKHISVPGQPTVCYPNRSPNADTNAYMRRVRDVPCGRPTVRRRRKSVSLARTRPGVRNGRPRPAEVWLLLHSHIAAWVQTPPEQRGESVALWERAAALLTCVTQAGFSTSRQDVWLRKNTPPLPTRHAWRDLFLCSMPLFVDGNVFTH